MILPSTLKTINEWLFVGPMGPEPSLELKKLPTLAVDGGANYAKDSIIWVGDADSYQEEVKAQHIYKHPVAKDRSDLALALMLFSEDQRYKLHLWGFLGGRRDHELFNLGEALEFLGKHEESQILFYGADGKLHFQLVGSGQWKFTHTGVFSLGSLTKTTVRLTGECQYPIQKPYVLCPLSSFGLSNVARGELVLENSAPLFIYYPEGK